MSNEIMSKKVWISDAIKKELNNQIKETLAHEEKASNKTKRSFTSFDMWNLQRNSRSATALMRRWNLN